jgi:hypothetical protein
MTDVMRWPQCLKTCMNFVAMVGSNATNVALQFMVLQLAHELYSDGERRCDACCIANRSGAL